MPDLQTLATVMELTTYKAALRARDVTFSMLGDYPWLVDARVQVTDGKASIIVLVTRLDATVRACVFCHVNGFSVTTRCISLNQKGQ